MFGSCARPYDYGANDAAVRGPNGYLFVHNISALVVLR
jgi:hypothetical protein